MAKEATLVIMAKQPRAGFTKTRLCPPLTPAEAAGLSEAMLLDTLALAAGVGGVDLAVAITPPESRAYFTHLTPPGTLLLPVTGADIGDCLVQALKSLLKMGYRKVLALNADGPSLPRAALYQAVGLLEISDVVIGPGRDGGYYLVGLKRMHSAIFSGIAWSTGEVFAQTLERIGRLGLRAAFTPPWYDVDTAEDLVYLQAELAALPPDSLTHTRQFLSGLDLKVDAG